MSTTTILKRPHFKNGLGPQWINSHLKSFKRISLNMDVYHVNCVASKTTRIVKMLKTNWLIYVVDSWLVPIE